MERKCNIFNSRSKKEVSNKELKVSAFLTLYFAQLFLFGLTTKKYFRRRQRQYLTAFCVLPIILLEFIKKFKSTPSIEYKTNLVFKPGPNLKLSMF